MTVCSLVRHPDGRRVQIQHVFCSGRVSFREIFDDGTAGPEEFGDAWEAEELTSWS